MKGKYWKYEKDKKRSKVLEEVGEDRVSDFGRRSIFEVRVKEVKEDLIEVCGGLLVN